MSWNAIPSAQPNAAVAPDDLVVVGRQQRAGLDRGGDQRRGLAADHVEVELDRHQLVRLARRDVDVLALAERDARLVVEAHQPEDLRVAEPQLGQPVERDPRQAEQHVAGVDRLGHAVDRPERRPVAAFPVAVLDVVVDEAEVVAQLDRGRARQRRRVVACDRGVGEEAQQRPDALAGRGVVVVQPEVVADHLVDALGGGHGALADDPEDLRLGVRDQRLEVKVSRHGRHRGQCSGIEANMRALSSLLRCPPAGQGPSSSR